MAELMNTAIIFIKNDKELELASAKILGKNLIDYTVRTLKKLDLDNIYLVGAGEADFADVIKRDDVKEIIDDLKICGGKSLLLSPFYPLLGKNDYMNLLDIDDEDGVVALDDKGTCAVFVLPNDRLETFENIDFRELEISKVDAKRVNALSDITDFTEELKMRINAKLISNGVNIVDPYSTYIGQDVIIDKTTIIYPGVVIEGKCLIGKGNVISGSSYLINVVIGDGNNIVSSRITDSIIHNNVNIGPNAHIRNASEIYDEARIGNYVEIKNTRIGKLTRVAHLAYLGDAQIGEDVNIGCGVITINYDGTRKYATIIKDHAFIGSNANLIAPITVGEYSMVAAGSTVDEDVLDGDMAISRLYQTNKKGYGYRYINKEN